MKRSMEGDTMSLIKTMNNNGPRFDPCGTTEVDEEMCDSAQ